MTDEALALDIGATKLGVGVVDRSGSVRGWRVVPTLRDSGPSDVLRRLFDTADEVLAATAAQPVAVGLSCGGPLDPVEGVLLGPLHLPGWDHVPVVELARNRFGVPARLVNDGSAGAWGEHRWGAAAGSSSSLYLTVSSGIGGGAVIDGRLLRGASGNGGEFGHVLARPGGRLCSCGRRGCAEAYGAGTQMAARAREAIEAGRPTELARLEAPTAADIAALTSTDAVAKEIWSEGVDALASAVTDLVNALEPERVVLGGGLTGAGELLLGPVRQRVRSDAIRLVAAHVHVVPATLGDKACAIGVGDLALDHVELLLSGGRRG